MVGLDDVREWVSKGVDAHGWGPVLRTLKNLLYSHADDFQAAGHPGTAAAVSNAAAFVGDAARAVVGIGPRPKDPDPDA